MLDRDGRPPTALDPLLPLFEIEARDGLTIPQVYARTSMPTIDCQRTIDRLGGAVVARPLDRELFATHLDALGL
jgi:hypothetical protein